MKSTLWVAVALLLCQLTALAQLAFDVASINENTTIGDGGGMRLMPGGGINARHMAANFLISLAYHLEPFQLVAVPAWSREKFYDVSAKPAEAVTREEGFKMLQTLLIDRFKLAFHRETRQIDGFALVRARPGALGPNLRASALDCEKAFSSSPRCREGGINTSPQGVSIKLVGAPIWSLLEVVIGQVGAPVTDDTQLSGTFDFDLQWSNDVAPANDLPSLYTALQEQAGLKLEKRRVSAEMFVVDRFEPPTPD